MWRTKGSRRTKTEGEREKRAVSVEAADWTRPKLRLRLIFNSCLKPVDNVLLQYNRINTEIILKLLSHYRSTF